MGRDDFTKTRAFLRFYLCCVAKLSVADPLWHSRIMLDLFRRNAAMVAVPNCVLSLDENAIRCKGLACAKSYLKSKLVKFEILMYAVVGWRSCYLYSLADNNSGNKTGIYQAESYVTTFRELRGAFSRKMNNKLINKNLASALWVLQAKMQGSRCQTGGASVGDGQLLYQACSIRTNTSAIKWRGFEFGYCTYHKLG